MICASYIIKSQIKILFNVNAIGISMKVKNFYMYFKYTKCKPLLSLQLAIVMQLEKDQGQMYQEIDQSENLGKTEINTMLN